MEWCNAEGQAKKPGGGCALSDVLSLRIGEPPTGCIVVSRDLTVLKVLIS